jgi:hypothetical protein
MQTLGLSDSTPRTEGRLKSLFWPSIETGSDVDYLGRQGFWVCTAVAIMSFVFFLVAGRFIIGAVILLFYYLAGVGVRERSRYAAAIAFITYLVDSLFLGAGLLSGGGILRIVFCALLFSNLRATWIASGWKPESEQAVLPPRLRDTLGDKMADQFPQWLWPKVRIAYYVFSAAVISLVVNGTVIMLFRHSR